MAPRGQARAGRLVAALLRLAIGAVALVVFVLLATLAALRSGMLSPVLDRIITALAQEEGVFFVRVEDVSGELPWHVRARRVEVGDGFGTWLVVEDADIHWQPFDLFHPFDYVPWRVNVDDARAARLEWTRLPEDAPDEPDEPFHWDRFIRIVVGHIVVDELDLSGPIVGGASARLRAEGSGVLGEWDHGFVRLDGEHVDGRSGHLRIDVRSEGSPPRFGGRITAEEAPGGALAGLARMPDAGAITLDVTARGPLADWHADAVVTATGVGRLEAAAHVAFVHEGPVELSATFDPVREQRQRYLVGEGGPMKLVARGAVVPDTEVRVDRATLDADGRILDAAGRLDLATKAFTVKGTLARADGGVVRTTILDATSVVLEGRGTLADGGQLAATLAVAAPRVAGVEAEALEARLDARDEPGDEARAAFKLAATARGLALDGRPLPLGGESAELEAGGSVDVDRGIVEATRARLASGPLVVEGPVSLREDWGRLATRLHVEAASLATLDEWAGMRVEGSARGDVSVETAAGWEGVAASIELGAADVVLGEPGWNALVGGRSTLRASWKPGQQGGGHGEAGLEARGLGAAGLLDVDAGGRTRGEATARLDNLSLLAEPTRAAVAGRADAKMTVRGDASRLDVDVVAGAERFSWNGARFDRLDAKAAVEDATGRWKAGAEAEARQGTAAASLRVSASSPAAGRVVVDSLALEGPKSSVAAQGVIDLETGAVGGTLRARSDDLSAWKGMTGVGVEGKADLDLRATPAGERLLLDGHAKLEKVGFHLGPTDVHLASAGFTAEGLALGGAPSGRATLAGRQWTRGRDAVARLDLAVAGDGRAWSVETAGAIAGPRPGEWDGAAVVVPGPPWLVDVRRLSARVPDAARPGGTGRVLALASALRLRVDPSSGSLEAEGLDLRVDQDGRLAGSFAWNPAGAVRIDAEAAALPLDLAALVAEDFDLEGTLDARVKASGASLATLAGEATARGKGVASRSLEEGGVSPVDVEANARFARGRVSGSATLAGLADSRMGLTLDAPLAGGASSPFEAALAWKGELAEASALLPLGEDTLRGRIDADLRVTGTMAAPRVSGRAVVDGARWEMARTGLVLDGLHAEVVAGGSSLELVTATATDGAEGRIRARGAVRFGALPAFEATLDAEADEAVLARAELLTARADARVAVRATRVPGATQVTGSVAGTVDVHDARLEIPQRFVADVPELDVVEVGGREGTVRPARRIDAPELELDLGIRADNRIFVTGRGLESEWTSDLHVGGTTLDPRVTGEVRSVRGQLGLLGRRFDVTSATLRFDGAPGNIPYLAMTARAEANDITAIAEVTGPATRPAVELRSEPMLPRDEVLSRVLFGQNAASLTPLQSVQLARSIAELAGSPLGGGGGLVGGIGKTLGFDRLGIESSGADGAAALTASKYLTDSVYLRVQQGLTPEASKLSIEWRVMKNLTVESDVSQDAQGEVGATWRWDY